MNNDIVILFSIAVFFEILLFWIFVLRPIIMSYVKMLLENQKLKLICFVSENNIPKNEVAYQNTIENVDALIRGYENFSFSYFLMLYIFLGRKRISIKEIDKEQDLRFKTNNLLLSKEISNVRQKCTSIVSVYIFFSSLFSTFIMTLIILLLFLIGALLALLKRANFLSYSKNYTRLKFSKILRFTNKNLFMHS